MTEVWIWAEQRNHQLLPVSLELLGKGQELKEALRGTLAAVVIGDDTEGLARELVSYGAEKVYRVDHPDLAVYQPLAYARVLADLAREGAPEIILLGGTANGMDLAPRVAARLATGLTAHCIDLRVEESEGQKVLAQIVPGFGGNLLVKILCPQARPQMATVRPGVLEKPAADPARTGEIITREVSLDPADFRVRTLEVKEEKPEGVPLEEAEVVVSSGWGFAGLGGIDEAQKLADLLGAAMGGTRPVVDAGWLPADRMIGQSGKNVRPRLFISLGASGAMHYTTGFSQAKVILAVDQNPGAPIFELADVGIVGDLREILPELHRGLEELLAEK